MRFKIYGFDYTIYATTEAMTTSEAMKCFGSGQACHAVRSCPDKLTGPGPVGPVGLVAPELVAQRALPEAAGGSGMKVVVGNLETEQQAEVAETDSSNAPIRYEIVTISTFFDPKSTHEPQSITEASHVDMTGDLCNEDQIMVQEDGTLFKFHLPRESKKKIIGKGKLLLDLQKNRQLKMTQQGQHQIVRGISQTCLFQKDYFQMDRGDRVIV